MAAQQAQQVHAAFAGEQALGAGVVPGPPHDRGEVGAGDRSASQGLDETTASLTVRALEARLAAAHPRRADGRVGVGQRDAVRFDVRRPHDGHSPSRSRCSSAGGPTGGETGGLAKLTEVTSRADANRRPKVLRI